MSKYYVMLKKGYIRKNIDLSEEDVKKLTILGITTKNLGFKLFVQNLLHELAEKQTKTKKP